ncbi:hypothetical protein JB92DRAFT_3116096 [Gautieria morchelliformis]|nr:hypothetical protein JB92DRAFT_3116096 [Gautieria morchelliformis]
MSNAPRMPPWPHPLPPPPPLPAPFPLSAHPAPPQSPLRRADTCAQLPRPYWEHIRRSHLTLTRGHGTSVHPSTYATATAPLPVAMAHPRTPAHTPPPPCHPRPLPPRPPHIRAPQHIRRRHPQQLRATHAPHAPLAAPTTTAATAPLPAATAHPRTPAHTPPPPHPYPWPRRIHAPHIRANRSGARAGKHEWIEALADAEETFSTRRAERGTCGRPMRAAVGGVLTDGLGPCVSDEAGGLRADFWSAHMHGFACAHGSVYDIVFIVYYNVY